MTMASLFALGVLVGIAAWTAAFFIVAILAPTQLQAMVACP